jgi:ABC-type nitrate/sulfonate/bicarbonate transport system permease component
VGNPQGGAVTASALRDPAKPSIASARRHARSIAVAHLLGNLGSVLVSIVVTLALWIGFIRLYHVPGSIAKTPLEIWRYVFTQHADKVHALRSAAQNRHVLFHELRTTIRDAALGYVAGIVLAVSVACLFVLQRTVEQTFVPISLALRAVPLIAMAPLLTLIFGRDIMAVSAFGGIVCFFPALINIMYGLRACSSSSLDLMTSYGASKLTTLRKILIPTAIPSIFASMRICVPLAITGALLAEWLATGKGSGNEMLTVLNTFDYGELWASVVLVTAVSMLAYSVVSVVEAAVLARYAPETAGRRR